jgi:outer membrane protein OmpA-like peptidoglycan-associated protein
VQTHAYGGIGIAFRLSERANLGLEAKALFLFGHDSDLLDGVAREESDVLGYGSVRLNFNLGGRGKSEPLYWVNPMLPVWEDLVELKERPIVDLTDSDGDGVADALDQDDATAPGVPVDTRGLPLDSDGDGTPNHLDDEPFGKGVGIGEDAVRGIVRQELDEAADLVWGNPDVTGLFLPNVHFEVNKFAIRDADLGNLAGVARMMKSSPSLRVVVTGFADKTASDQHNLDLSYKRARAVIEHLVEVHGLPRSRFLLHYNGEDAPLVPTTGSSLMNRRVELRAATASDLEMEDPVPTARRGGRRGSGF